MDVREKMGQEHIQEERVFVVAALLCDHSGALMFHKLMLHSHSPMTTLFDMICRKALVSRLSYLSNLYTSIRRDIGIRQAIHCNAGKQAPKRAQAPSANRAYSWLELSDSAPVLFLSECQIR